MTDADTVFTLIITHLWQSTLLAGVLAGLLAARRSLPARTRHMLAFATLVAAAVLPAAMLLPGNEMLLRSASARLGWGVDAPFTRAGDRATPPAAPSQAAHETSPARPSPLADDGRMTAFAAKRAAETQAAASIVTAATAPASAPTRIDPAPQTAAPARAWFAPAWFKPAPAFVWGLLALWIAGAVALLARTVVDAVAAERLRRRAVPVALPASLAHLVGDIDVRESAEAPGPMAAGVWKTAIILPPGLIARRDSQELLGLLAHEAAHVERGDLPAALLGRVLTSVFWWSPAVAWIATRVEEEREMACDEAAADRVGDARAFARTLTNHAEAQLFWGWPRLVVGAARGRSLLGRRVRRLLEIAGSSARRPVGLAARACGAVLLAVIAAAAVATPRIEAQDTDEAAPAAPAPRAPRAAPAAPDVPAPPVPPRADDEALAAAGEAMAAQQEAVREAQRRLDAAAEALADDPSDTAEFQRATDDLVQAHTEMARVAQELAQVRAAHARVSQHNVYVMRSSADAEERQAARARVEEARQALRDAQRNLGRSGGDSEQIDRAVEALADAVADMVDGLDVDVDFDWEPAAFVNLAQLGKLPDGRNPSFSFSFGWDDGGTSPLMAAAQNGDLDTVEVLVDAGADVNALDPRRGSVLLAAVSSGDEDIVRYLLEHDADPNLVAERGDSPLMAAARNGDVEIARMLADAGADVDVYVPRQGTALMAAVRSGDADLVRLLIELGADVEGAAPERDAEFGRVRED